MEDLDETTSACYNRDRHISSCAASCLRRQLWEDAEALGSVSGQSVADFHEPTVPEVVPLALWQITVSKGIEVNSPQG